MHFKTKKKEPEKNFDELRKEIASVEGLVTIKVPDTTVFKSSDNVSIEAINLNKEKGEVELSLYLKSNSSEKR